MKLKVWLHIFAALVGLGMAALIVFLVFGQASRQNTVEGAPGPNVVGGDGETLCGSIPIADVRKDASVEKAKGNLPAILDHRGNEVTVGDGDQLAWFRRLHAASGLCLEEVAVGDPAKSGSGLGIDAIYEEVDAPLASAYIVATLDRSFERPLARRITQLRAQIGDSACTVRVTQQAWANFLAARQDGNFQGTIAELRRFARKVGYGKARVLVEGCS